MLSIFVRMFVLISCFLILCFPLCCQMAQTVIAPIRDEIDLRAEDRNMHLTDAESRMIADMIVRKNFSIFIEFKQREHTHGSLLAVYSGKTKVLELVSDGLRAEMRIRWRRGDNSLATRFTSNIDFDDEEWHKVIFEIHGDFVQATKDCQPFLSESFPELEFGLLRTNFPKVWVGQGSRADGLLMGQIRHFKVKEGSFLADLCHIPLPETETSPSSALHNQDSSSLRAIMNEFRLKLQNMEAQMTKWNFGLVSLQKDMERIKVGLENSQKPIPTVTTEPDISQGVCPNCYEYIRHKTNYLENEFKRWRDRVESVQATVKQLTLFQRGCQVKGTAYKDGENWQSSDCVKCTCHGGKAHCHPVGCRQPAQCARPRLVPGDCCPSCGHECFYMKKTYEDGAIFRPKPCVLCECKNGNVDCVKQLEHFCPKLTCAMDQRIKSENECCPVCANTDHCASSPCHPNAVCANQPPDKFQCICRPGFFGDGYKTCVDFDECSSDQMSSNDQKDSNSQGNKTAEIDYNKTDTGLYGLLAQNRASIERGSNLGPCGAGARCINTRGSYYCECLVGFTKMANNTCYDSISQ